MGAVREVVVVALVVLWVSACGETKYDAPEGEPFQPRDSEGALDNGAGEPSLDGGTDAATGPLCGNGQLDGAERCDTALPDSNIGACPSECTPRRPCETARLVGVMCGAHCLYEEISTCVDDDGCCPLACGSATDSDCTLTCGDGRVDSGELCDGNCPTAESCADGAACTADGLTGSAETCDAECSFSRIEACADGDGCCASGCTNVTDDDCSGACGNDVVEEGETCDGDCPTACDDENACTVDTLTGSPDTCNVECGHASVTGCLDDDGCCPDGCNANNDNDCDIQCGNGVVEGEETCDGNCPVDCDDGARCTTDSRTGSAETCDVQCENTPIAACIDGDMCCAPGCDASSDDSCSARCGNGVVEGEETCDGNCPTDCNDGDVCTTDDLLGSAEQCSAECVNVDIVNCMDGDGCCAPGCNANNDDDCEPICGNGEVEGEETCDGNCPSGCDDSNACTLDSAAGSADSCDVQCTNTPIEACTNDDGCCAPGCNANNDNDCNPQCHNDIVEPPETCDGDCPTSCDDGDACTVDSSTGSADTCDLQCAYAAISSCADDDGCCAPGCNANNDNDCTPECGNGAIEAGEECDSESLPTATCDTSCQTICVWVVEYETTSEVTVTDAISDSANDDYPQSETGTAIFMFTDEGGAPGDGPMGLLYTYTPTNFTADITGGSITTDVTVTGGTPDNLCPIATGSLASGVATWDACAYVGPDWGTTAWDPDEQQVASDMDAGCARVQSSGTVTCDAWSYTCSVANLESGENPQDDAWDQPLGLTTFDFASFASGTASSYTAGGTAYDGSPYYPDDRDSPTPSIATTKTEAPTHSASRLWRSTTSASEVSRACVPPPTDCP